MIKLNEVHKVYSQGKIGFHALKDINLYFEKGEIVTIFGPSGCGKTTLLNIIGGLDQPTSGDMVINTKLTTTFGEREWDYFRNHQIGFIFQQYNLIEHLPIVENVAISLKLSGTKHKESTEKAIELLKKVGLEDHLHKLPGELSGGERQRVAIARALINDPDIILADEPTGALDKKTGYEVMDLIKSICADKLVIIVTHNKYIAERYATRQIDLKDGRVVSDTKPVDKKVNILRGKKVNKKKLKFKEAIRFSLYNIKGKLWRTLLVSFGLSIGIVGLIVIDAFFNSIREGIENESAVLVNNPDLYINDEFDPNADPAVIKEDIEDYGYFKEILYSPKSNFKIIEFDDGVTIPASYDVTAIETPQTTSIKDTFTSLVGDSRFPSGDNEVLLPSWLAINLIQSNTKLTKEETWDRLKGEEYLLYSEYEYIPEYYEMYEALDKETCIITSKWDGNYSNYPPEYDQVLLGTLSENMASLETYRNTPLEFSETEDIFCADYDEFYWYLNYEEPIGTPKTVTIVGIHDNDLFNEIIVSDNIIEDSELQANSIFGGAPDESIYNNSIRFRGFLKNDEVDNKVRIITNMERDGYLISENTRLGLSMLGPVVNLFVYIIQFIFSSIVFIAIITGALMLLLILFIGIIERKREIGLIRAMGGTRGDVRSIYSGETTIIGLISGVMSIIFAIVIILILNAVIYHNYFDLVVDNLPFVDPKKVLTINFGKLLWAIFGALIIAFLSGLAPAVSAGRKKPIEALRNE